MGDSGWDGFAPASNAPSDRPAFGGTCYTNIFNVPIKITSYDDESIKASSIFTATNSLDQAFAYPYEGFALGVAVLASTTGSTGSQPTSTTVSSTASPAGGLQSSQRNTGILAGAIVGSVVAALLLTGIVALMLNYRRKRLSDHTYNHTSQFPNYATHIRLNSDGPTPMVYLSQPPQMVTQNYMKRNDRGQVNRYENGFISELEGTEPVVVHEMDGGTQLPSRRTKELPSLPPPDRS
jgi:hypothetical protein